MSSINEDSSLPGSTLERSQLAIETLHYLNLVEVMWNRKANTHLIAEMLHHISDPREQERMEIRRGTSVVATLKKNRSLWSKLTPYFMANDDNCSCGHWQNDHVKRLGRCKSRKNPWDTKSEMCACNTYREKPL